MNNIEDELSHRADEDLKQDMTKFMPQKAHEHKETAMGWNTRFSRNIRKRCRVKGGDTIDIFHPEV